MILSHARLPIPTLPLKEACAPECVSHTRHLWHTPNTSGERGIRTPEGLSHLIYSQAPLCHLGISPYMNPVNVLVCASGPGGSRTHTPFRVGDFKSPVSAYSTTGP